MKAEGNDLTCITVLFVSSYQEECVGMQVSCHKSEQIHDYFALRCERNSSPPSTCDSLSGTYGTCSPDPAVVFPLLTLADPCLGQPQLLTGFMAALHSGHLVTG